MKAKFRPELSRWCGSSDPEDNKQKKKAISELISLELAFNKKIKDLERVGIYVDINKSKDEPLVHNTPYIWVDVYAKD